MCQQEKSSKCTSSTKARCPADRPPFTLSDLRAAIPQRCFERSILRSSAYLVSDLAMAFGLFCMATYIQSAEHAHTILPYILWPIYWFFQGAVCTGLWVIAHECGHQAFSTSRVCNDTIGCIVHSCLLVPYWSWKYSHRRHHSGTGSVTRDEVFVPRAAAEPEAAGVAAPSPLPLRLLHLVVTFTLGWPLYLVANVSGREYPGWANHFDPRSPIFNQKEAPWVAASDAALVVVACGLVAAGRRFGWLWLLQVYGVPYLIVNFWLVMITLLQHTHPALPHFDDNEWEWLRGALATVDRDYGFLNVFHHHIADTHVAHHLFSAMPHYHAVEATAALREALGPYYVRDSRNVFVALWQDFQDCRYVAPDSAGNGVLWYRK